MALLHWRLLNSSNIPSDNADGADRQCLQWDRLPADAPERYLHLSGGRGGGRREGGWWGGFNVRIGREKIVKQNMLCSSCERNVLNGSHHSVWRF